MSALFTIMVVLVIVWIYVEVVKVRRKINRCRSAHPDPNARRATDMDDSGKARRGTKSDKPAQFDFDPGI